MARTASLDLRSIWQQRIEEQCCSGLSVIQFCKQQSLLPNSFYSWRRKLAKLAPSNQVSVKPPSKPLTGLVPVRIVSSQRDALTRIQFASGVTIEASAEIVRVAIDQILATEYSLGHSHSQSLGGARS
jgi:hypothetical protein